MRELYLNRYNKLIEYAKQHPAVDYAETHHIIPKSLGGLDTADNLIKLPSRLHFIAHWMLWKAYDTNELAYAFWAMAHQKKRGQEQRYTKINSKTYAILKERRSKLISKSNSDRWKDPVWAEKMAQTLSKSKSSPEVKAEYRERMTKQNADPEFRKNIENKRKEKYADPEWYANYKKIQKQASAYKIKPIIVDGIEYPFVSDVANKYNISISTVRQRIKSKTLQFSSWHYKV